MHGTIILMLENKRDLRVFQQLRRCFETHEGDETVICGMAVDIIRIETRQIRGNRDNSYGGDRAILEFKT